MTSRVLSNILVIDRELNCSLQKGHNTMIKLTKREQEIKRMMEKLFGKKVNDEVLAEVIRSYDAKYGIKNEESK